MSFWINAIFWAIIIGFYMWQAKPKPLTIAFIISLYVGLETYFYVNHWISYLPVAQHIIFYAIPIGLFLLYSFIYCIITKNNWEQARSKTAYWYIGVIVAVWLSFPTVFMLYDWQDARIEYETEMEELFGEDWEDEVEELEEERFSHRP